MLWLQIFAFVLVSIYFALLRPRRGGKDAPPLVLESPVFPIPVIGVIMEFFKSPNNMVKRCYRDYGPVFTIPVSYYFFTCSFVLFCFVLFVEAYIIFSDVVWF